MATTARYLKAADNSRPYKSHRYDVFGIKVERTVTLFGRGPLNAWISLEADPSVIAYCERPLVIPDTKPKRVIDFWVCYADRQELWVLPRKTDPDTSADPENAMSAFLTWAKSQKMAVRFFNPTDPLENGIYLDNWGRIIRELSSNRRFLAPDLMKRVSGCIVTPRSMAALIDQFPDEDSALVHSAALSLVHSGKLRITHIHRARLGFESILEAA